MVAMKASALSASIPSDRVAGFECNVWQQGNIFAGRIVPQFPATELFERGRVLDALARQALGTGDRPVEVIKP